MNTDDRGNPLSPESSTGPAGADAPTAVNPVLTGAPSVPSPDAPPWPSAGYPTSPPPAPGSTYPGSGGPGGYPPGGYPPGSYPPPAPFGYGGPGPVPTPPRRLTRSGSDRVLGGVCGGLARYWNTDPVLLRILTVVLTLATGGALLVGYLIAWIVIPSDQPTSAGGPGGGAGGGYAGGGYAGTTSGYGTAEYAPAAPPQRSYLGWLVVSIAALAAGIVALIGLAVSPTAGTVALVGAVVVTLLGLGMVVGAWYGRARWLTVLAIPLAFLTFSAVAAQHWIADSGAAERWVGSSDGGISIGSRAWDVTPADLAQQPLDYRVSAGDAVLDLTALTAEGAESAAPRQRVTIDASVGLGQLTVLVPPDMRVNLSARLRAGEVLLPGATTPEGSGTDLTVVETIEPLTQGQPAYVVDLDVAIGAGNLEVHRDAA